MNLGIVVAKDNSNRFTSKNKFIYKGKPLFWHSVQPLLDSPLIDKVVVATDSEVIHEYCKYYNVSTIHRAKNASRDEDKLINIIRFAYYNLEQEYDIIVSIMANCPGHTSTDVELGIKRFKKNNLKEVRSFNSNGEENGIMILHKDIIEDNRDISYYMGSIETRAKEIHYKKELDEY
jgi:CMP-N-acetylneuraminic acid synthetase